MVFRAAKIGGKTGKSKETKNRLSITYRRFLFSIAKLEASITFGAIFKIKAKGLVKEAIPVHIQANSALNIFIQDE